MKGVVIEDYYHVTILGKNDETNTSTFTSYLLIAVLDVHTR